MYFLNLGNLIGFGISFLITIYIASRLIRSYLKSKEITVRYFASFITARLGLFGFVALSSLVYLISGNLLIPAILFTIAMLMAAISLVFPPLLFCSLKWPKMKQVYPGVIGAMGIIAIIWAIIKLTPATIIPVTGFSLIIFPQLTIILYMFIKFFGIFPLAILFLFQVRSAEEKWIRIRSLLIGIGLLWVASTLFIPNILPGVWAGIYCCIGDILIFTGILYNKKTNI